MKVITPPKIVSFQEFASMQFGGMITFRSCICYISSLLILFTRKVDYVGEVSSYGRE